MPTIQLPNGWTPRPYQEKLWRYLHSGGNRAVQIAHRRWGKDEVGLHYTACAAHEKIGAYWHLLPEATQARKAVWDAVNPHTGLRRIDEAFPLAIRELTRENEMFIRFKCGSTWQVVGSDNYNALVGTSPRGIVFSEWALSKPYAWSYLRPILAENGGWALFITTPRGRNHAATMYEEAKADPTWFCNLQTAHDTDVFTPEQLDRERAEYQRELGDREGDAFYRQEYLADFDAPVIGAIYAGLLQDIEKEGHITDVDWRPEWPVYTSWDLGKADSTAIWFFQVGPAAVYWIDYHEATGEDAPYYAKILANKPYTYKDREHFLPWDARITNIAAKRSFAQQLEDLGVKVKIVPNNDAADRIAAARVLLRRSYFDRKKCKSGLEALRDYHYAWDDKLQRLSSDPVHNWASHGSDSFGYGAIAYKEINPAPFKKADFRPPTLGEITRMHDRSSSYISGRIS
jgi:phage terminase large subunit